MTHYNNIHRLHITGQLADIPFNDTLRDATEADGHSLDYALSPAIYAELISRGFSIVRGRTLINSDFDLTENEKELLGGTL